MAELVPNSFTTYALTEHDVLEGSIYTTLQLQVLQNTLAAYAEEKIALDYDSEHPLLFAQNEASLKAKIELLTYMIEASKVSSLELTKPQL